MTEMERNNKIAMITHGINVGIMVAFLILQAVAGELSMIYVGILCLIGFVPVIAEIVFWKKDHNTDMIKHFLAIGFAIFYSIIIFTSSNGMTFLFVIPMILVVMIYNDTRYIILINTGTVIESLLLAILGAKTGRFGYSGQDNAIIQVVIMLMIGFYSYFSAKTSSANSMQKIDEAKDAYQKTESVLSDISHMSKELEEGIKDFDQGLEELMTVSESTREAMKEVSQGAGDTADAVQRQMEQTEAIQTKVEQADEAAEGITQNMKKTLEVLEIGTQNMLLLVERADASVSNGEEVAEKLKNLESYMEQMHSIVEVISGITSQTSLLSLNASIEAARAGEAGRGFAVVASEISGMAVQTQDATVHITELIKNVSDAITEVVNVVYQMIDGIHEERESTASRILELKNANQEIVDSIQTISAISEEVTAHAGETMNAEEKNAQILNRIKARMNELQALIKAE